MDEPLRHQRDISLAGLASLIAGGREIQRTQSIDAIPAWQHACAAAIHQLAGGSKAHWLSRAFSSALLVRAACQPKPEVAQGRRRLADGGVVVEADAREIVDRILDVLAQGAAALSGMDAGGPASAEATAGRSGLAPRPRQFEFVHNAELRPVLEQVLDDSRAALERGEWALSLILSCSAIETLLTDALESASGARLPAASSPFDSGESRVAQGRQLPANSLQLPAVDASFEVRIAEVERRGLIRSGCNRLPPVARRYAHLTDADGELRADSTVSEREARVAGQVLRVVMRDLNPGR